jgi:hypothetical protein
MGIVDDLLANPGVYIGTDRVVGTDLVGAARIVVTPLPGKGGVSLDYEVFNPASGGPIRGHAEHTVVGKTHDGGTVMVIGHTHGESVEILRETEPGVFELGDEPSAFPMKVVVSVPEPGKLHHVWWYGPAGEPPTERDVADLELST